MWRITSRCMFWSTSEPNQIARVKPLSRHGCADKQTLCLSRDHQLNKNRIVACSMLLFSVLPDCCFV